MNIICLKWGDKFNHVHVNRLYKMVCKNYKDDFNFICYTENSSHIDKNIEIRNLDLSYNLVRDCIDQIYNGDEVFETADLSKAELDEFVEHLTTRQFSMIRKYFESLPIVSHLIKYQNPKTGKDFTLTLQGASDFFQ